MAQSVELLDHEWYCKKYLRTSLFKKTRANLHYLFRGISKDLNPNKLMDLDYYKSAKSKRQLRSYSDCAIFDFLLRPNNAFVDPSPNFNGAKYLTIHSDVRLVEMNPFIHYYLNGRKERRAVSKSSFINAGIDRFIQNMDNFILQKSCLVVVANTKEDFDRLNQVGDFDAYIVLSLIHI